MAEGDRTRSRLRRRWARRPGQGLPRRTRRTGRRARPGLAPAGRRGGGLTASDPDRAEPRQVGAAPEIRGGQGDAHAGPVLAGPLGDRGAQHQTAAVVALTVGEAVGRHPDGARHPVFQLQLQLQLCITGAVQGQDRADRGLHVRRRGVGGGPVEPVGGDGELVLGVAQRLLQLDEALVQSRQPFLDEVGEFQPCVDGGAAVRVVAPAGGRDGVESPDLLDQAQLPVPASLRRRALVAQPLELVAQPVGRARAEWLGLDLHPDLADAHAGGAQDTGPQRVRVQRTGQSRHPHPAVGRHPAPGQAPAERALRVHHDRIEGRSPPLYRLSRHVLRPRRVHAERSLRPGRSAPPPRVRRSGRMASGPARPVATRCCGTGVVAPDGVVGYVAWVSGSCCARCSTTAAAPSPATR